MTKSHACCALALFVGIGTCGVVQIAAAVGQPANTTKAPQFGICDREAPGIAGVKPAKIGGSLRSPRKMRDVPPRYPDQPAQTKGSGMWAGEALIDAKGKISHVWTIREVSFTPPFPEFNQSIVDAIRQWEFEPTVIGGAATPVCMVVTMNINWR